MKKVTSLEFLLKGKEKLKKTLMLKRMSIFSMLKYIAFYALINKSIYFGRITIKFEY